MTLLFLCFDRVFLVSVFVFPYFLNAPHASFMYVVDIRMAKVHFFH